MASKCHCKLFSLCEDKGEYQRLMRTVSEKNKKSAISSEKINDSLFESCESELQQCENLTLIHDPSDIRKPYSKSLEKIGKVRDLKSNIINGYSTHNIVGVVEKDKSVHLLSHRSYSNKDDNFLSRKDIKKLESGKAIDKKQKDLYKSDDYFNKKSITEEEIKKISKKIKSKNPSIKITHVLDREFDDDDYLNIIHKQQDQFVIRSKKSRLESKKEGDKTKAKKLIETVFKKSHIKHFSKVSFGGKVYQDVKIKFSWQQDGNYTAVKIEAKDRKGEAIFADPMLLMTNITINTHDDAYFVYVKYLQRAKIESVFKFLKDGLGWETVQVRDFKAIQNLLSLCFYVACYLYRIGEQKIDEDYMVLLSEIGGGKGKVTRHFILEGLKYLFQKHRVDQVFKKRNVSRETQEGLTNILELC